MIALYPIVMATLLSACTEPGISPEDIAQNDRGVAQMGRYEYGPAHDTFAAVTERNPDWNEAVVNLAIATLNRQEDGDEQRALSIVTEVLGREPEQIRALYVSGIIHLYLGNPVRASEFLARVAEMDPLDAYAAYFLGQSHLQQGDYESAAVWLQKAAELDPYLRSAYWAGSQVLRRLGRTEESAEMLAGYQRFDPNPAARTAGFSYRKMGSKAEAKSVITSASPAMRQPSGALLVSPEPISDEAWGRSITAVDVDSDRRPEVFMTGPARTLQFASNWEASVPSGFGEGAEGLLWGDIDDDGLVDVVRCSSSGSQWIRQTSDGWVDPLVLSESACNAGAVFDSDHDGDLDVFLTGAGGSELWINHRDGSFRNIAEQMGIDAGVAGRQVLAADLDADRDIDILILNQAAPHYVWQNDRTWRYRPFPGLESFTDEQWRAVTYADANADGHAELFGLTDAGALVVWAFDGLSWQRRPMSVDTGANAREIAAADFNGNGLPEVLVAHDAGFKVIDPRVDRVLFSGQVQNLVSAMPLAIDPGQGPGVLTLGETGLQFWAPGPGRYEFVSIIPTGRTESDQMRSNASGIGTAITVRAGGRWSSVQALDSHSGPGQSLTPVSIGLGGRPAADYVALQWSDGVSQTELDLAAGQTHVIAETQRQLASCPVIFAWDGERYRFVSDVLGVGGLGFFSEPGISAPPRPFERFLLPDGLLAARDGHYQIKLTEPMEENAYVDSVVLAVYDLPEGWSMVLDERMGTGGAAVTGRPIAYRESLAPARVTDAGGRDVTPQVLTANLQAPEPGPVDHRFIGLLAEDQILTIEFDQTIDRAGAVLMADGWVEYPYSQTVFAAWQAGIGYRTATLEARGEDGTWSTVAREFGYPAGMPRQMALPMPELPAGTTALRLSSNMEIYWDRLQVVFEEQGPSLQPTIVAPRQARVARTGFPRRTNGPQKVPQYDYSDRAPYWDTKYQRGFYTALGDASELLAATDGALAIIGGGEEIHLAFPVPRPPEQGMKRHLVLDFRGWAKDMDLYTADGETVAPVPLPDYADQARRDRLHSRYNVRFQEGMSPGG